MLRLVYIVVSYLLTPALLGVILWRGRRNRGYWKNLPQRFGFGPTLDGKHSIWVHAVSVGEVQAAAPLVRALQAAYPDRRLVITTMTPTGAAHARMLFGDTVDRRFVPYDLPGSVKRFFNRIRPGLAVILETELWPNLYNECGRRGVPLVLASARISPRSINRYRLLVGLFRETLSHGIIIGAQSEADALRFRQVGAAPERTYVTGNIKFDFRLPSQVRRLGIEFRERHAALRPVWVAASTHAGEEEIALAAHERVLERFPDALLLLVPRHPERFDDVAELLTRQGFSHVRRSTGLRLTERDSVFLGDTLGELTSFYAAADVAFVAGSLVPIGGHNLLEPAALGLPVLTGPHTYNCEDIAEMFIAAGAARLVTDAQTLGDTVGELLADAQARREMGARGQRIVEDNRGALERLLKLVRPLLPEAD
ncbi:MAG: lipid IV(A) 3-deoxy-D-manno-octulosonic acid transferase [Gammaproteobacteria bacterium]|nr:lipid IV(A) 3-deoxy-D-manno-octulosonic acid transferase [Gammaproteobacteria bacterium]